MRRVAIDPDEGSGMRTVVTRSSALEGSRALAIDGATGDLYIGTEGAGLTDNDNVRVLATGEVDTTWARVDAVTGIVGAVVQGDTLYVTSGSGGIFGCDLAVGGDVATSP